MEVLNDINTGGQQEDIGDAKIIKIKSRALDKINYFLPHTFLVSTNYFEIDTIRYDSFCPEI